ncbi:MAG: hypothetical protein V2A64_00595 [Candidatus Omnitrophota bacterium]
MSAPREVCNIQLVKIQPEESLASASERNFTPDRVTCYREAKGMGYRATTQVKGLSSEINHRVGGRYCSYRKRQKSYNHYRQGYKNPTESKTVALYQKDITETWENQYISNKVCNYKPVNGEDLQMIYWWSDKSIVARKFLNGNGAKGLTREPKEGDTTAEHSVGEGLSTKPKPMTYLSDGKEVFLKSWMRENCTSSSVRGFIVSSQVNWRWL